MSIFISIPAYRDPDLLATVADAVIRARWPADLHFGICLQGDASQQLPPPSLYGAQIRTIAVPYQESQGCCWARSRTQELYQGEDYYLQIDSHHRFVQGWDHILIDQYHQAGCEKAVISAQAPAFFPGHTLPTEPPATARMMWLERLEPKWRLALYHTIQIPSARPVRARFVSGHYLFSVGRFVTEVPSDKDLYFHGEEISLAIRAFTHGYDLYHPSEHTNWHCYYMPNAPQYYRRMHADDHVPENGALVPWIDRDNASRAKILKMLKGQDVGPCGLGTKRGLREYERYAKIFFASWTASADAYRGIEPG